MRLALLALLAGVATPAVAAPVHQYGGLALSADGLVVATIEAGAKPDPKAEPIQRGGHGVVTIRSGATGTVLGTIDPCAACQYSGLTFASDGAIAFLARDRTAGTVTLDYVAPRTMTAKAIATVSGIAQTPRFAPDGKRIALLVTLGAAKESGATSAGVRQIGEIGEHPDEQRLAVFDIGTTVATADVKPLSPADRYVYEYDWAPDGRTLVVTSALGNGDNNWWVATLDAVDAATGAVRNIARPTTQINMPKVSPDGRSVAYIGGLMSDFGSIGGDIWTVPLAGGTPVNATQGDKATVTSLAWKTGGLRAVRLHGDQAELVEKPVNGPVRVLFARPSSFAAGDGRAAFSADGSRVAMAVQDFEHAPAIYAGPIAGPRPITHDNDAAKPAVAARSITWTNDGYTVQGWLLMPLGADSKAKAPMIVDVHGGPAAASGPSFLERGPRTDLLDAGYYEFLPNPRGSYGQGEAFTAANRRDFGGGDLRDILAGVDAVEKVAPIDDARLGLMGGSYGGFMAMWANTQTNRFKAIVAGAGLSNWVSYYGTNGIDQWMLPFFGKTLYEDRAAYEAVSAVNFARQAHTPTFIYVGERDIEVPPTQSIEWWHALKDMGVPTSLVIYPNEGHGLRDPANGADVRKRTRAWFDTYLARK